MYQRTSSILDILENVIVNRSVGGSPIIDQTGDFKSEGRHGNLRLFVKVFTLAFKEAVVILLVILVILWNVDGLNEKRSNASIMQIVPIFQLEQSWVSDLYNMFANQSPGFVCSGSFETRWLARVPRSACR
jgi:hypothetical protein